MRLDVDGDIIPRVLDGETAIVLDEADVVVDLRGRDLPIVVGRPLPDQTDDPSRVARALSAVRSSDRARAIRFRMGEIAASGLSRAVEGNSGRVVLMVRVTSGRGAGDRLDILLHLRRVTMERDRAVERLANADAELERFRTLYRGLVDPSPAGIVLLDADGEIVAHNPAASAHFGIGADDSSPSRSVLGEIILGGVDSVVRTRTHVTIPGVRIRPERERWFDVRISPAPGGDIHVVATDATDRVRYERRLALLATTDPLTGVGNRARLNQRIAEGLRGLREGTAGGMAVAIVDLDHFALINDAHGHVAGDLALVRMARRIEAMLDDGGSVCRAGGDEFVLVLSNLDSKDAAEASIRKIHAGLVDGSHDIPGIVSTVSVGFTWLDTPFWSVDEIIAQADEALRRAKRHGRNRVTSHRPDVGGHPFPTDAAMAAALSVAFERDEFALHYQPIVDTEGRVLAVEALLRWYHPEMGVLTPAVFMERMLASGLIVRVGAWVIEQACRDLAQWKQQTSAPEGVAVHINVAPDQFVRSDLPRTVVELMSERGLDPGSLCIEITEQALSIGPGAEANIKSLDELGVTVALDDFGTGSSSLAHLRDPGVRQVKVDRTFVAAIGHDPRTEGIISGLLNMASELGITVVAEGVETDEQRQWLAARGCSHIQGFLVSEPVPAAMLPHRLASLRLGRSL